MKRVKLFSIAALVALCFSAGCTPEGNIDGGGITPPSEHILFTLNTLEPYAVSPNEDVAYDFTVAYSKGIASVATSLDGEVIEGSEKNFEDSPTEVGYNFKYTIKDSQFGQTLNFVFTATGADGKVQSVDYAVWVSASAVEFAITIPASAPGEITIDKSLNFEVLVECGYALSNFKAYKGESEFFAKADFGATDKTYKYPFQYTPAEEDVNNTLSFRFVATDVKGNTTEATYEVKIKGAPKVGKELWSETFNTTMEISHTTAHDTEVGNVTTDAAQFMASNIVKYNSFEIATDPENPESEKVPNEGAMAGCKVYDNDVRALVYTSDGVNSCLSKYKVPAIANMDGAYLWIKKNSNGWLRVDGIKLHGATTLKLSYSQAAQKIKVEYSLDGGTTWTLICASTGGFELYEQTFTIPADSSAETISLKFTENGGSNHVRLDNLKLTEIL